MLFKIINNFVFHDLFISSIFLESSSEGVSLHLRNQSNGIICSNGKDVEKNLIRFSWSNQPWAYVPSAEVTQSEESA